MARKGARLALALWIACAVVVWNVVFDRVLVLAGREYVHAATVAADGAAPYARINDWMRPALGRALWLASGAAGAVLVVGMTGIRLARRGVADG